MCYKLPGPRCTPQALDKFARWSRKVDAYQAQHPDWGTHYGTKPRYTRTVDRYVRFTSDYWTSAGGLKELRSRGEALRQKALLAKRRGDVETYKRLYKATIDIHNRCVEAAERREAAKRADNERRRAVYAAQAQAEAVSLTREGE